MEAKEKTGQELTICNHRYHDYLELVRSFHGHIAPGMVLGGFMVDLAYRHLPEGEFFDALCETKACLPDAIQILTPCTIGNGWLRIIDAGRYALTLFEKYGGLGVRVYVDPKKLESFSELKSWFFKLKPKREQDGDLLLHEIVRAGSTVCGLEQVRIEMESMSERGRGGFALCPSCREGYLSKDGPVCLGCQGQLPYIQKPPSRGGRASKGPSLRAIPVEDAVGKHALHDMTRIIPGQEKGPAFKRNQTISVGDICRLQRMGRQSVYVSELSPKGGEWIHEDEAAKAMAGAMSGQGVDYTKTPSEGKVEMVAARDGLFVVDKRRLADVNRLADIKCASRHSFSVVSKGDKLAGTRAVPLYIHRDQFDRAIALLNEEPLFQVIPMRQAKVGILVTGTEIFLGMVEERFIPIITEKVEAYKCGVIKTCIVPDDRKAICEHINDLLTRNVDLLVTTAGLSVDPDDVTRRGLMDAGAVDLRYGTPILPGNMTLLAHINQVQVIGVPACALYHKTTSFDLLLPRLLADIMITEQDLVEMGHGGICLSCPSCKFPDCPFGK